MRNYTTRERLLDSAYRILSEESLSQLSIDHVAERAGLSRRTFFLHFGSKDELLAEVLNHVRPAYAETYRAWTAGIGRDLGIEERIYALFRNIIEAINEPGWKGCCFLRLSAEFGSRQGHPVHPVVAEAQLDLEKWLEEELSHGSYADPARVAQQLVLLLNGLLVMQLIHHKRSYAAAVLCMLPDILAAGRPAERLGTPVPMRAAI